MITTQVYLIMYLLMFVAAIQLRRKHPDHPRGYRAPDARRRCAASASPPRWPRCSSGSSRRRSSRPATPASTSLIVGGGALGLGLLVPFLFYRFRKPSWKQPEPEEVTPS